LYNNILISFYSKGFNGFKQNTVERRYVRVLNKKAYLYYCDKTAKKVVDVLKKYKDDRKELKGKRDIMFECIKNVDIAVKKKSLIDMLKEFNAKTNENIEKYQELLLLKKKLRLFNAFRYNRDRNCDLKIRFEALKEATDKRIKHRFILKWVEKYDLEWNIKNMQLLREQKIKSVFMSTLLYETNKHKMLKIHLEKKKRELKFVCFHELLHNMHLAQEEKFKETIADECYNRNLSHRGLLGFKFHLLTAKNIKLMETKRNINYQLKAFGSLKWNWEMTKMKDDFLKLVVEPREMRDAYHAWKGLTDIVKERKRLLEIVLARKEYYEQMNAFYIWKRDAFFKTTVNLLDQYICQPENKNLTQNVFYAWKRAHEFEKVRENCERLADATNMFNSLKRTFKEWKTLVEPGMQRYLKIKRAISLITNTMVSDSYFQMIAINQKEKHQEEKVRYFEKSKQQDYVAKHFEAWKALIDEQKVEQIKVVEIKQYFGKTQSSEFSMKDFDSDTNETFCFKNFPKPVFRLPTKILIQTTCIKAMQKFVPTTGKSLLIKYFNMLKYNCKIKRLQTEQIEYSKVHFENKMKKKYMKRLIEKYREEVEYQQSEFKARQYYYCRSLKIMFNNFIYGIKISKQEQISDKLHSNHLKIKVFAVLKMQKEINERKRMLNSKMVHFMKERTKFIVKHSYFTWKHHFELESYYKKAVNEFQEYRKAKLIRSTFKAMLNVTKQDKLLRDLEDRATNYFTKRVELRLIKSAFDSLKNNATKHKFLKSGKAQTTAEMFYAEKLLK
jgi:hypothetical protein